ncbi:RluA family pseudouridine synthase [Paenibacillus naphthalenovorans]|uniref:RNA pseudouridylate synthase n=1 Tax=Paenibacillus naphthalenovorans TaxID=162209 RepID=A0A0U2W241_9BACL|nr:RluA family pseudouridine synthase [Paenibacillus naphthalenovorans]ALS22612.1 pseudouridine synthase [Paenibacillus naphthalenovorans]SDH83214.1 23S rRNA pseudouridine1911/1915/1917 synthase [Paenibacillus naphthalenovorans]
MSGASHPLQVLYEDNHVIVVIKPPNVPTQEDDSGDPDMLTLIKADLKQRYQKPGNVYLGLVHRLDRPVGGVMVFAKTSKAASRLSDAVRTRSIRKVYTAVVHGRPLPPQGTLRHHLLKDTKTNTVSVVPQTKPGAKDAILDYRVLDHQDGLSLVQVELQTGRPHQIRVQFAEIGCPLAGDQRYGGRFARPGQQIALWSTMLSFEHPVTKESLSFSSRPPGTYPWSLWDY